MTYEEFLKKNIDTGTNKYRVDIIDNKIHLTHIGTNNTSICTIHSLDKLVKNPYNYIENPEVLKPILDRQVYLWCEDAVAGQQFWKEICKWVLPDVKVEHPKVYNRKGNEVWNNVTLMQEVLKINDTDNIYIILFDSPFNNLKVHDMYNKLKNKHKDKSNIVFIDDYIGFESILLSFEYMIEWIGKSKSNIDIELLECLDYIRAEIEDNLKDTTRFDKYVDKFKNKYGTNININSIEKFCKHILSKLVEDTGYVLDKDIRNTCWLINCISSCAFPQYSCDLKASDEDKSNGIYNHSYIKDLFEKEGVNYVTNICR